MKILPDNNGKDNVYYANELSESRHNVAGRDGSSLLELNNQVLRKRVERRIHKRFQVNQDAFALIRPDVAMPLTVSNRSMAEIAFAVYRSKPSRFGRINNISMGGLSFRYIAAQEPSYPSDVLDVLLADCAFYLKNLPFKSITDFEIIDDYSIGPVKMRQLHVQFKDLVPNQVSKLKDLIQILFKEVLYDEDKIKTKVKGQARTKNKTAKSNIFIRGSRRQRGYLDGRVQQLES